MQLQAVMISGGRGCFAILLTASVVLGTSGCSDPADPPPRTASSTLVSVPSTPTPTPTPRRPSVEKGLATAVRELGLAPKGGVTPLPQSVETLGIGVAYPSGKKTLYPHFPVKGIPAQRSGARVRVQSSYGIGIVAVTVESLDQPLPAKLDYCDADWTRAPAAIDDCSLERISPTMVVQTIDFGNLREMRLVLPRTIVSISSGAENLQAAGAKPALTKLAQRKLLLDPRWR